MQRQQFFLSQLCGERFYSNAQRFVWRRPTGSCSDGHQHGGRKPTETSVTAFFYKSASLSREEQRSILILFLIRELFRQPYSPKQGTFLTSMTVLSTVMKRRVKQNLRKFIRSLSENHETQSGRKFVRILVFSCCYTL